MLHQPIGSTKKRVLIVDDSATIRRAVAALIQTDPQLEVAGQAADAEEARRLMSQCAPDVITLDINMPGMDGLTFLQHIMSEAPMPVVMLSATTQEGSADAIQALSSGAVDCVAKEQISSAAGSAALVRTVHGAAHARVRRRPRLGSPTPSPRSSPALGSAGRFDWNGKTVLIGSSTGGVDALQTIIRDLPRDCPPVLISQHMPALFLRGFVERMDREMSPKVVLAEDGMPIRQGQVYVAPGGDGHLQLRKVGRSDDLACHVVPGPAVNGHWPSVDVMFSSALDFAPRVVAALLTGMGRDGAQELLSLRQSGAKTIAQDEETSVVFGMPKAAIALDAAQEVLPVTGIAASVLAKTCWSKRRAAQ